MLPEHGLERVRARERAEAAMRHSDDRYRDIFNAAADAMTLRDEDFRVVDVNPAFVVHTGFSREEALGRDFVLGGTSETEATILARHRRVLAGAPAVVETSRVRKDGAVPGVELLALDVRSDASVSACVTAVLEQASRIDVLVNNAAYELAGALEETSLEETKAQFETNFFGVVRMIQAVLPSMRRQKDGRIVNVSSLSGVSSIPFMGIYSASKFALEGYTEALRMELKPFNIHVSLTEAGFLRTPMMDKRQVSAVRLKEYDHWRQRAFTAIRQQEEKSRGGELVAETLLEIISSPAPRLRYLIGPQAKFVAGVKWFLPAGTYERAKMGNFGLGK